MQDPAARGHVILVAEDNTDLRSLFVDILTHAGYQVLEACDGEEAVAVCRRELPALVLMDVTMPGTSGWNAVRALKADSSTTSIPIIVVTGLASSWDRDASLAAGADQYIAKPVSPSQLLEEVRMFLAR